MARRSFCITVLVLAVCAVFVGAGTSTAFGLRCGNDLVDEGDTKVDVYRACGEPDYRDVTGFREIGRSTVKIEIWFYDFGPQKFTQTLTFYGNRLARIEAGDYGTKTFGK